MRSLRFCASPSSVKAAVPALAGALALTTLLAAALGVRASTSARTLHAPRLAAASAEASTNWAGYAVTSPDTTTPMSFSSVTGTWTQTTATCGAADANAASAAWVGLGGYSLTSLAVEQIGTDADCTANGKGSYYAWYELVPGPRVKLALPVRPGDLVTASVSVVGTGLVLQLRNRTRNALVTERVTPAGPLDLSSAEWIAEAPSLCAASCRPLPLADFGAVTFSRIAAVGNRVAGTLTAPTWSAVPLRLVPRPGSATPAGTAPPSLAAPDGRSFTVAWLADATASAPAG